MDPVAQPRPRKPRADAQKNRERLIEAAKEVLGPGGPEASMEAVAKRAGVGIGTLYRHFPNRQALFHAVFSRELDHLVALSEGLEGSNDPVEAIRGWLHGNVAMVETKRGMLGALSIVITEESMQAYGELKGRITASVDRLLVQAAEAGQIREGVTAEDLLQTMYALCYARAPGPDWREHVLKMLDIFVDGLKA
ncbi:transcriptional regulator [Marinibacterium profundimaris]|uniref:Transcriptional regulator n=1 Tax=Marinibacterium profundimaris TaxID=1679460 RepID=A0A225NQS5_9RHOB|nr:transcriptional regulator [Marinibacterium profundimaris]